MATTKPREGRVVEGVLVVSVSSSSGVMVVVVEPSPNKILKLGDEFEDEAKEDEGRGRW